MNSSQCSPVVARLSRRPYYLRRSPMRLLFSVFAAVSAMAVAAFAERELHVVGVYEGINGCTEAKITVDRPGQSVTLFLSAYDSVNWQINVVAGTALERVFLDGYYVQTAVGV